VKELLQLLTPFLVLAATWFLGQRILISWDLRKKRQELDIAAATQFQQLYGEAKEVARLWRVIMTLSDQSLQIPKEKEMRWQLLARATAVEGRFEAVVIKLTTERLLSKEQVQTLGLFRGACQDLRDAISDMSLPAMGQYPGYILFNNLAVSITQLLNSNRSADVPNSTIATENLIEVTKLGWESLQRAVEQTKKKYPTLQGLGVPWPRPKPTPNQGMEPTR
jgi:hypothetical protein